jgi:hypothetical protein
VTNVDGSVGLTPYSKLARYRVDPRAVTTPMLRRVPQVSVLSILKISLAWNLLMLSTLIAKLSRLHVQPNLSSVFLPSFLVPKPSAASGGDRRLAPPDRNPSAVSTRLCRVHLCAADRLFWVWLSKLWSGWRSALAIVKPATVISWHRQGFRLYCGWRSGRGRAGRPTVSQEVRGLIRKMSLANVRRGAPRIHGDCSNSESRCRNPRWPSPWLAHANRLLKRGAPFFKQLGAGLLTSSSLAYAL